jgi:hypothetical protein
MVLMRGDIETRMKPSKDGEVGTATAGFVGADRDMLASGEVLTPTLGGARTQVRGCFRLLDN